MIENIVPNHHRAQERPTLGHQVEKVKTDFKDLGEVAGRDARRKLQEARGKSRMMLARAREKCQQAIEERPFASLAAAAGLGALAAGLILGRK